MLHFLVELFVLQDIVVALHIHLLDYHIRLVDLCLALLNKYYCHLGYLLPVMVLKLLLLFYACFLLVEAHSCSLNRYWLKPVLPVI